MAHNYTPEQITWLRVNYPKLQQPELRSAFNAQFNAALSLETIKSTLKRYKIISGRSGQFIKGPAPHNAGVKGLRYSPQSEFKKGNMPYNHRPVGSEQFRDGYWWVKTANPRTWKMKHRLIWEAANGPIPDGHVVIFLDGDQDNTKLENLALVTRAALTQLNRHRYSSAPAEIKRTLFALAKLEAATFQAARGRA
jgi:hypothetical protein